MIDLKESIPRYLAEEINAALWVLVAMAASLAGIKILVWLGTGLAAFSFLVAAMVAAEEWDDRHRDNL